MEDKLSNECEGGHYDEKNEKNGFDDTGNGDAAYRGMYYRLFG